MSTRGLLAASAAGFSLGTLAVGGGAASPGGGQAWVTAQDTGRIYVVHGEGSAVDQVELDVHLPAGTSSPSPHFARISPSGKFVYVPALHTGKVYVLRAQDRELVDTIQTPDSALGNVNSNPVVGPNGLGAHDAKPSPDGSIVLVAHWGTNSLYKVEADEDAESWSIMQSKVLPGGLRPICVVYHPGGQRAYVGVFRPGSSPLVAGIVVVDVDTLDVSPLIPTAGAWSCSWAMTRDGQTLYLSTTGARFYRLDLATDALALEFTTVSPHIHGLGMNDDEKTLFATSRDEDELQIIDIATGAVEELSLDATPGLPDKPDSLAVRGDNVWVSLRGSGKLALVKGHQRPVKYLELDPDLTPCPAAQTLCYAIHSVELGY